MRHYNLSFADLIDALTIDQIKEVLLPSSEARPKRSLQWQKFLDDETHDLDILIRESNIKASSGLFSLIMQLAQCNLMTWYLKDDMETHPERYAELLSWAQDLNGLRNAIRNILSQEFEANPACHQRVTFLAEGDISQWYHPVLQRLQRQMITMRAQQEGGD